MIFLKIFAVVAGSFVCSNVDYMILGINWAQHSRASQLLHKLMYMLWGIALFNILRA